MSAIINVFASIGLVAILVVIIYYIWKYIDQLNKDKEIAQTRPSAAYMQSIGIKCPDYWTLLNTDSNGNYICRDDKDLMTLYNKYEILFNRNHQISYICLCNCGLR